MASCTKVTGATSAVAQFYQRGELDLSENFEYCWYEILILLTKLYRYSNLEILRRSIQTKWKRSYHCIKLSSS